MHSTNVEVSGSVPSEVLAGADVVFKVKVSCSAGCDLRGMPVKVTAPDGAVVTSELATCEAGINETDAIALKTPRQVGEHAWNVVVPAHESAGVPHAGSALPIRITTAPHGTSLAVWDIPSPVVMGDRFAIKVGAKSASGCELEGCDIAVCDEAGALVARGRLQEAPWPGTTALYWTQVELVAPARAGICAWSVRFAAPEVDLPHDGSVAEFGFAVVKPPEHTLTVKVIEKDTKAPIENALVRLGAFRAATDQSGVAEVQAPKGAFELIVWKAGYESPPRPMDVNEDAAVEVEAVKLPEENPDEHWTM